jgi:hypothetical protein
MSKPSQSSWQRPRTLFAVVRDAESTEDIGLNLSDFLDHLNLCAKQPDARSVIASSLRSEPPPTGDRIQDAYLAAVAAYLAHRHRLPAPRWTDKKSRRLDRPWFALPYDWARATLLRDSPAEFRERNLFTTEDALHRA